MPLQMYVVEVASCSALDSSRYLLNPTRGVMAFASSDTDSTARIGMAAGLSEEVLSYFALGFAESVANTPGLAKHEDPPARGFRATRLAASLRLAHERISVRDHREHGVTVSAVALNAWRGRATLATGGPYVSVWHARNGAVTWLRRNGVGDACALGIGADPGFTPTVTEFGLVDGDLVGIGLMDDRQVEFTVANAAHLDDALAGLLERSLPLSLPLLIGRWRDTVNG